MLLKSNLIWAFSAVLVLISIVFGGFYCKGVHVRKSAGLSADLLVKKRYGADGFFDVAPEELSVLKYLANYLGTPSVAGVIVVNYYTPRGGYTLEYSEVDSGHMRWCEIVSMSGDNWNKQFEELKENRRRESQMPP